MNRITRESTINICIGYWEVRVWRTINDDYPVDIADDYHIVQVVHDVRRGLTTEHFVPDDSAEIAHRIAKSVIDIDGVAAVEVRQRHGNAMRGANEASVRFGIALYKDWP